MKGFEHLLRITKKGFYCEVGDFYIDPWEPVPYAVITHGHSDHARPGMRHYLCTPETAWFLKTRFGKAISVETLPYGKALQRNGVSLRFVPSGHIRGAAQVVLEYQGKRVVVSGDYKRQEDRTTLPFQEVTCDLFVSEATFGFPVYQWEPADVVLNAIQNWWWECYQQKKLAILCVYSLGKAQRVLSALDPIHFLFAHPAIYEMNQAYRHSGFPLPHVTPLADPSQCQPRLLQGALYLLPPQVKLSPEKIPVAYELGAVSGWYASKRAREKSRYHRYFVLSDHADWNDLISTILGTQANHVLIYHGKSQALAHVLQKQGIQVNIINSQ